MANVKLRISTEEKTGSGWYSSPTPSGKTYWYKFTGGNDGNNGNQKYTMGDSHSFVVEFKGRDGDLYSFAEPLYVFNDPDDQLSGSLIAGNKMLVIDACTAPTKNMIYGVHVHPAADQSEIFLCHPRISNQ
jgi:hypothetical protein